jgi:hypothetical protein
VIRIRIPLVLMVLVASPCATLSQPDIGALVEEALADGRVDAAHGLVPNGDFEAGSLTGFEADSGWAIQSGGAHGGGYCARVVSFADFADLKSAEPIRVVPGHQYYCRYATKRVRGTADLTLRVDYFREDGTACETYATQASGSDTGEWRVQGQLISDRFPEDVASIKLWFHHAPNVDTETLLDDVVLVDASPLLVESDLAALRLRCERALRLVAPVAGETAFPRELASTITALRDTRVRVGALGRGLPPDDTRPLAWWQGQVQELGVAVSGAERSALKLAAAARAGRGAPFALGTASSMLKVFEDKPFPGEVEVPARVELAANEYEGTQVAIIPLFRPLSNVRCGVSDLEGPGGARIARREIELHRVGTVVTKKPDYAVTRVGAWPDPLLPPDPFDVPEDEIRLVWITVHAAVGTPPGTYTGTVTIATDQGERRVPLTAEVWGFTLPAENHLQTTFVLWPHMIARFYGQGDSLATIPPDQWERDIGFCNRYRVGAMNVGWGWDHGKPGAAWPIEERDGGYDYTLMDRYLGAAARGHMPGISMADFPAGPYSPDYESKLRVFLTDYAAHLKQRGWFDSVYLKLQDEPEPDRWPAVRAQGELVHSIDPSIKTLVTAPIRKEMLGAVDIWVPLTPAYDHRLAEERRALGEQVWWYICCAPAHPYPNYFIDYPAIDQRILFWMNWKYHVNGFLYWGLNWWADANLAGRDGAKWPDVPWDTYSFANFNGDGHIVYPGRNGDLWSSVRMENIRDSVEDYEYLWLLNETLNAAPNAPAPLRTRAERLLAVEDDLVASPSSYTSDPARLYRARRELAETIVALRGGGR